MRWRSVREEPLLSVSRSDRIIDSVQVSRDSRLALCSSQSMIWEEILKEVAGAQQPLIKWWRRSELKEAKPWPITVSDDDESIPAQMCSNIPVIHMCVHDDQTSGFFTSHSQIQWKTVRSSSRRRWTRLAE